MATVGLYGSTASSTVASPTGSESVGLYGNNTVFGGSYFEWFIFQVSDVQPATPTGGTWDFTTNTGTPPTGWLATPPVNPTNTVWVSIGLVNSKSTATITWSVPGKFSFASGLPILSGTASPAPADGQSDQLYIQTSTVPETIWFKQAGTWTRITGSTLYADLTSSQTIAGTKTFSSPIVGSVTGTSANVTGIVAVANGGTGVTTSTGSGSVVLSTAPTLANPTISNYEAFTPSAAPTYAEGLVWYDSASYALAYYNNTTNNTIHLGQELQQQVRNSTGSTITKGQVVYISGSTGQIGNIILAKANTYVASQVIGVANQDIPNNTNGWIVTQGTVTNINTSTFTAGNPIYLSATTAGALTQTEPNTPNYAVHMGMCLYSNTNNGKIYICPINNSIDTGYIIGQVAIAQGGTNGTVIPTAGAVAYGTGTAYGFTAAGTSGQVLTSSGTGVPTWTTPTTGTVTSVTGTLPVVSSGGTTPAISLASGYGDTQTPYASKTANYVLAAPNGTAGVPTFRAIVAADIPTLNQNTTGTSANVTGTVAVANGGTGVTTSTGTGSVVLSTSPTLVTPLLGTPTSGNFSTGTFTWPTFNQSTTGNAATATTATNVSGGTASVTTLTASSTVTLSGGTANGVGYLNASKQFTTGTALTFDGTNLGVGGDIQQANATYLKGKTAAGTATRLYGVNAANNLYIGAIDTAIGDMLFVNNGAEQMRLTSTGLGIGTSSPGYKLDVRGVVAGGNGTIVGGISYSTRPEIGAISNHPVGFITNNTTQMLLDTSGNLGLGVTPSAWLSGDKAFQIKSYSALSELANGKLDLSWNAYEYASGAYKYLQVEAASKYTQVSGAHTWFTAPSGTAGNAISFTQAMTLNASGFLGVGTTGPAYGLVVSNGGAEGLEIGPGSQYSAGKVLLQAYNRSGAAYVQLDSIASTFTWQISGNEKARIDSSGNLLVGTTSSLARLTTVTNGTALYVQGGNSAIVSQIATTDTTGNPYFAVYYTDSNQNRGSVQYNRGTGLTLYNTTSDYRAKDILGPVVDSGALIDSVPVYMGKMKGATQERPMFIAHETPEYAHTGEKDAVDVDGKPVYQQMDASALIPVMWAEIQSLRKRLAAAGI